MNHEPMTTGERAVVRLLKALARAHAFAQIDHQDGGAPRVRVCRGSGGALPDTYDVTHHAAWDVWQRAQSAGFVECGGAGVPGRWSISALGRAQLRDRAGQHRLADKSAQARSRAAKSDRASAGRVCEGPQVSPAESPLVWLYRRRDKAGATIISAIQFEAGERLRTDYEIAQLMPRLTVDWTRAASGGSGGRAGPQHGLELSERALAARERVARALNAVGPELASLLVDVCCHLKGLEQLERAARWPQRSAKIVLQVALSALARHYGLERRDREAARHDNGPAPVRHWGADGYRPATVVSSE